MVLVKTMTENVTFSIGNIALIEKADDDLNGYFNKVFGGVAGKAKDFIPCVKTLMTNRMGDCFAITRLNDLPVEYYKQLGFKSPKSDRTLNRTLERIGQKHQFIIKGHQEVIKEHDLVSKEQFPDFSSSYFEGKSSPLGELGYSRDNQPGKKQITFGICTGINGIPSALTIQKGNVQDKKHMRIMLRTAKHVLEEKSILIFDCGGNTKKNKRMIRAMKFHYLTLRSKKVGPYKKLIKYYKQNERKNFKLNGRTYSCVKMKCYNEFQYIFFSKDLFNDQIKNKNNKFLRELERNKSKLKKTLKGKALGEYICDEGYIITKGTLQKILGEVPNPYLNDIEGFFVLQSSIDEDPQKILSLYKDRDKAEKLIRNMKEGTELHPIRHWSKWAVIGYLVIIFLTNFLINLTLLKAKSQPLVKNVKLLKKYLMKLTLTIVYPKNSFKFHIISNISEEIRSIFGDYIDKYRDKSLHLRW
jgi:transposase